MDDIHAIHHRGVFRSHDGRAVNLSQGAVFHRHTHGFAAAEVDRAQGSFDGVIVRLQPGIDCVFILGKEGICRRNPLAKLQVIAVETVVRNLKNVRFEILRRIHRHKSVIQLIQVAGQKEFLAVELHHQNGGGIIEVIGDILAVVGCAVFQPLLHGEQHIHLNARDVEMLAGVEIIILSVGVKLCNLLNERM